MGLPSDSVSVIMAIWHGLVMADLCGGSHVCSVVEMTEHVGGSVSGGCCCVFR